MAKELKNSKKELFLFSRVPKILLVDDNPIVRYVLSRNFSAFGCQVDTAQDGLEAIDMFRNGYDFILFDLFMPHMNGIEAVEKIRTYERKYKWDKNIIIAVSSFIHLLLSARENTDFDDYYCKPFMQDDLVKVVRKWLSHLLITDVEQRF